VKGETVLFPPKPRKHPAVLKSVSLWHNAVMCQFS
jgi:hypothetical protein